MNIRQAGAAPAGKYFERRAADPIRWRPWPGEGRDDAAAGTALPILLHIGYDGSSWCERLARESFRDAATAELINRRFLPLCVDRDRRPDLDRVYQNAFQLLNGRPGGWPLLALLTPDDRLPFFAAGYLAAEPRSGLPGLRELLTRLADLYRDHEDQIRAQNDELATALRAGPSRHGASGFSLRPAVLEQAVDAIKRRFDAAHGGFDEAPKLVHAPMLQRLLRHYWHSRVHAADGDTRAGFIVKYTLEKIHAGPLRAPDGGYYRSADADWQRPQRERPLAENAQLLTLYAQTWRLTGSELCRDAASALADWLLQTLRAPRGGFFTAVIDADDDATIAAVPRIAGNGVAIAALAAAARHLGAPALRTAAEHTLATLRERCWRDGELIGDDGEPAYLDDYVWLLGGVLELLQCRWRGADYRFAAALAETLLTRYQEPSKRGGFYFTRDDAPALIQRPRPIYDDALPALNGALAEQLIWIGHWDNSIRHLLAAERALKNAWPSLERSLTGCCGILLGLESYFFPPQTVVIRGPAATLENWRSELGDDYAPRRPVLAVADDETAGAATDAGAGGGALPALLADCPPSDDGATLAYVCRGRRRSAPLATPEQVRAELAAGV